MSEEEIHFFKDQVQRLNLTLAKYQSQTHPDVKVDYTLPEVPWFSHKEFLAPLLKEYDSTIDKLSTELDTQKEYLRDYKSQVERLITENSRLQRDIKTHVTNEMQVLQHESSDTRITANIGAMEGDEATANIQQQLAEAVREKDTTFELWQTSMKEIDRLAEELTSIKGNSQFRLVEEQAEQLRHQYYSAVTSLNQEITTLKQANKRFRDEQRSGSNKLEELERDKAGVAVTIEGYARGEKEALARLDEANRRVHMLEKQCSAFKSKLEHVDHDANRDHRERSDYDQRITELQTKATQAEEQAYQAVLKVSEAVKMAEAAVLERQQAELREQQSKEECDRLQSAIDRLLDEAGSRTREEVELVRQQANQNLSRVIEELNIAETEKSEKCLEMERLLRDKKRLETELEKEHQEARLRQKSDLIFSEEVNSRALRAERERDEMRMQLESARSTGERESVNWRNERLQLRTEIDQLRDRIIGMNQTSERAQADSQRYSALLEEAETRLLQARKEVERGDRKAAQQAALVEQSNRLKVQEYECRLQTGVDSQRQTITEMRQMLAMQHKVSARWKEECHVVANKMEEKVTQQRGELDRQKKRNEDLTVLLSEARSKLSEGESSLAEYSKVVKKLEDRLKQTERRGVLASQQVSKHLNREQKWLDFKKDQQTSIQDALSGKPQRLSEDREIPVKLGDPNSDY